MPGNTLYSTACTYGGPTNALDDCGNYSSALDAKKGTSLGASYDFGIALKQYLVMKDKELALLA